MNKKLYLLVSSLVGIFIMDANAATSASNYIATPYRQVYNANPNINYNAMPTMNSNLNMPNQYQPVIQQTTRGLYNPYSVKTNAKYYSADSFDRLADSGVYLGLSVAYANPMGKISSDYDDYYIPGASEKTKFDKNTVMPLGISVGAVVNSDIRLDLSYNRYSGLSYPDKVNFLDKYNVYQNLQTSGGKIVSQTAMFNVYYNLESVMGNLFGGRLKPYIGGGVGISINTLSDYVVYFDFPDYTESDATNPFVVENLRTYHNGGTSENLAYSGELGFTTDMSGGLKFDFFVKYAHLGKVESSGSGYTLEDDFYYPSGTSEDTMYEDALNGCPNSISQIYDATFPIYNAKESGNLSSVDVGVRMRIQF